MYLLLPVFSFVINNKKPCKPTPIPKVFLEYIQGWEGWVIKYVNLSLLGTARILLLEVSLVMCLVCISLIGREHFFYTHISHLDLGFYELPIHISCTFFY